MLHESPCNILELPILDVTERDSIITIQEQCMIAYKLYI
jgi:hypothetical protein